MPDTIEQALARARSLLVNSDTARLDAEVLLASVLEVTRTYLHTWPETTLTAEQMSRYRRQVEKRFKGEPVAYLTGVQEFWSLSLLVNRHTLIPRPETEILVERALQLIPADANWAIADLGAGSGAIGLALARERPQCQFLLTDISEDALAIARENSNRLDLKNVSFQCSDWFAALAEKKFNMIVSNPPYIPEADPHLQSGDVRFEPPTALRAGNKGLDDLRTIINFAGKHLLADGYLLVEHGYDQEQSVAKLFQTAGYSDIICVRDYANQPRVSLGQWRGR